jgi:hypothetical protein
MRNLLRTGLAAARRPALELLGDLGGCAAPLGLVLVALEREVVGRVRLGRRGDRARTEQNPVAATMLASRTKTSP